MTNNITRKRRFIIDFGYPHGQELCALLGLVPADTDVATLEQQASYQNNNALYNTDVEEMVHDMATWAVEATSVGANAPDEHKEILRSLLIEFHRASLSTLVHERLVTVEGMEITDV
jgi:hypothetical protein